MPLELNENIFATKHADQESRAIRDSLGSARVSRVGEGVLAIVNFFERLFRRDAETSTRDACAPQKGDQPFHKLRQFIPTHCALSFFAAQMRLRQQLAQIFVTRAVLDQDRQNTAVFHG